MIKFYKAEGDAIKEIAKKSLSKNCWIDVTNPSEKEFKEVSKITGIPIEELKISLDDEERPRIEQTKKYTMIIYRSPFIRDDNEIETSSIGFFLTSKHLITIHPYFTGYVRPLFEPGKTAHKLKSSSDFLYNIFSEITKGYFQVLRRIEKQMDVLEDDLVRKTTDISMTKIAMIKKTLIYFHRSLLANKTILSQITEKNVNFIDSRLDENFKDLTTETLQQIEMTGTYRDILIASMETYSTIISNQLNIIMKTLTVITAILMIPTVITSFYGMNLTLPFADQNLMPIFVILISFMFMAMIYIFFKIKRWI